jgi:hypothetical protein
LADEGRPPRPPRFLTVPALRCTGLSGSQVLPSGVACRDRRDGQTRFGVPILMSLPSAGETRGAKRRSREGPMSTGSNSVRSGPLAVSVDRPLLLMLGTSLAAPSLTLAALGPSLPPGERARKQRCRTRTAIDHHKERELGSSAVAREPIDHLQGGPA